MMQVIEENFASFIDQFTWNDAQFPIVQNYNAHGETKAETIKQNMVKQLYSPVQFIKSTEWLIDQGVDILLKLDLVKYYLVFKKLIEMLKLHRFKH